MVLRAAQTRIAPLKATAVRVYKRPYAGLFFCLSSGLRLRHAVHFMQH
nr:MAG TPA: hypothetical protein [Caudoviricetes sp.]